MEQAESSPYINSIENLSREDVIDMILKNPVGNITMDVRQQILNKNPELFKSFLPQIAANKNKYALEKRIQGRNAEIPEKIRRRLSNLLFYAYYYQIEKNGDSERTPTENHVHAFMDIALWLESHYHKKDGTHMMRKMELGYDDKQAYAFNHLLQVPEFGISALDMLKKNKEIKKSDEMQKIIDDPFVFLLICLLHDSTEDSDKLYKKITPEVLKEKLIEIFTTYNISTEEIDYIIECVEALSFHNADVDINAALSEDTLLEIEAEIQNKDYSTQLSNDIFSLLDKKNIKDHFMSPKAEDISEMIRENDLHLKHDLSDDDIIDVVNILLPAVKEIEDYRREKYIDSKKDNFLVGLVKFFDIAHNACSKHTSESQFKKYEEYYIPFSCLFLQKNGLELEDIFPKARSYEMLTSNEYVLEAYRRYLKKYGRKIPNIKINKEKDVDPFRRPPLLQENPA